jgi:hypothetical protein
VQAYAAALATGDKAIAKSLVAGSAKQLDYVDAMVDEYQAIIRFDKALKAKFDGDATDYLDYYEKYGELAKKAEIEMEGDDKASATFEIEEKAAEEYWDLVKRNGQWSIDAKSIWDPKEDTETSPAELRKSAKAIDALTKRIIAGQFSSAEDAVEAYDNR